MLKEMFSATYKENKVSTLCYLLAVAIFSVAYIFHPAGYSVPSYAVFFVGACLFGYLALYSKTACGKLPFRSCAVIIIALFSIPAFIDIVILLASFFHIALLFNLFAMLAFAAFAVATLIVGFAGIKKDILNLIFACIGLGGGLLLFISNIIMMAQNFTASSFFDTFIFFLVPLGFFLGNFFEVFKDGGYSFKKKILCDNAEIIEEDTQTNEEDIESSSEDETKEETAEKIESPVVE